MKEEILKQEKIIRGLRANLKSAKSANRSLAAHIDELNIDIINLEMQL